MLNITASQEKSEKQIFWEIESLLDVKKVKVDKPKTEDTKEEDKKAILPDTEEDENEMMEIIKDEEAPQKYKYVRQSDKNVSQFPSNLFRVQSSSSILTNTRLSRGLTSVLK